MEEASPSAWHYRLAPGLTLRTRQLPPGEESGGRVVRVRGGEAFPPGHPTTRLCLDLLRQALAAGPAHSLADIGCGSGTVALAAAALGVPRVAAVDLAWPAAAVTAANARENGLGEAIKVVQGSTECLTGPFDLVAANLPWEVQMEKISELSRLAGKEGRLILSGFRDNQEMPLLEGYRSLGWAGRQRLIKEFYHPELPPDLSFNWVAWLLAPGLLFPEAPEMC